MKNAVSVANIAFAASLRRFGYLAKVLPPAGLFTISILAATANPAYPNDNSLLGEP